MHHLQKNVKGKTDVNCDALYCADFETCYEISDSLGGKICGTCRKTVTEFRKTGKTFLNVSMIILLTEKCVLKVIDEVHTKNTQMYFITVRWKLCSFKGQTIKKRLPSHKGRPWTLYRNLRWRRKLTPQLQMTAVNF